MEKPVIRKWIINRLLFTSRAKSLNAEGEGNTMVSDSISVIKVAKQPLWGNFFICMKPDMQIKYKWSIIKQVFYGYYGYICCKCMPKNHLCCRCTILFQPSFKMRHLRHYFRGNNVSSPFTLRRKCQCLWH